MSGHHSFITVHVQSFHSKKCAICDGFSVPTALHFYSVHLYTGEIGAGKYHRGISTRGAFIIKAMLQMLLVRYIQQSPL